MIKYKIPKRSYSGEKWKTNSINKKYLSKDFNNRCAYCDDLDNIYAGQESYAVEHFAPKEKFPHLKFVYDNLLYACPFCNRAKSDDWPSDDPNKNIVGECGYVSPCSIEYSYHLDRDEKTGEIYSKTKLGEYMYNHLKLYLKRHAIIYMLDKLYKTIEELKESIITDKSKGVDVTIKEQVLSDYKDDFVDYYGKIRNL